MYEELSSISAKIKNLSTYDPHRIAHCNTRNMLQLQSAFYEHKNIDYICIYTLHGLLVSRHDRNRMWLAEYSWVSQGNNILTRNIQPSQSEILISLIPYPDHGRCSSSEIYQYCSAGIFEFFFFYR